MRRLDSKSFAGTTADTTVVDLSLLGAPLSLSKALLFEPADFDIEVVGNDAAVTVEGVGPFTSSEAVAITDGSFAIDGGKISILGFALGSLEFTTAGSAYTINIIRKISE